MYSQEEIAGIYQRQYKMVYQICFMLMKNTPDAEDAAQTVFRKVIERDTPFRDPEHEKAWLIVTARNECRGQLKHWWRTRREDAAALDTLTWNQPESGLVWSGSRWPLCRKNTGWCCISTTTKAMPPARLPKYLGRILPQYAPGFFVQEKN